jgi:hypothetical protein
MEIGVPFRTLGDAEVAAAVAAVKEIDDATWTRYPVREGLLAGGDHGTSTHSIVLKYNFVPYYNNGRFPNLRAKLEAWCEFSKIPVGPIMPVVESANDLGEINVFPQWHDYAPLIQPIVNRAVSFVATATGVVTRIALVRMLPNTHIGSHVDHQEMAKRAHRIHVPLISPAGVEYKIDGKKLIMKVGKVYDFNNLRNHSVRNKAKRPRVNLMIDYLPNPGTALDHSLPPLR